MNTRKILVATVAVAAMRGLVRILTVEGPSSPRSSQRALTRSSGWWPSNDEVAKAGYFAG